MNRGIRFAKVITVKNELKGYEHGSCKNCIIDDCQVCKKNENAKLLAKDILVDLRNCAIF